MSATLHQRSVGFAMPAPRFRFGTESVSGDASVQWLLKRNCSMAPRQVLAFYLSLCFLSLSIGGFFWWHGATLVLPFTWIELMALGAALLVYARHASDSDHIHLKDGRLVVERASGGRIERVEFTPEWVRVEPAHGDRSLVELSGQGRRIAVGRFVRPELRRHLAGELRWALRRWQAAPAPSASLAEFPDPLNSKLKQQP